MFPGVDIHILFWVGVALKVTVFAATLGAMYLASSAKQADAQSRMVSLASAGFISLVCVYLADKVGALNIELLSPTESESILGMINNVMLIIMGYYFGSKTAKDTENL